MKTRQEVKAKKDSESEETPAEETKEEEVGYFLM